jgi:hypothetical protein
MRRLALRIAAFVLSCGSALLVAAGPNSEQAKKIAEIEGRLEGRVEYDEDSPDKPVISINLTSSSKVTDAWLAGITGFGELRVLWLGDTNITDAGLPHLKGLTKLQDLDLGITRVTDDALVNLRGLARLEKLDLQDTGVTDSGLANLEGLKRLSELQLGHTMVTNAGLAKLKALPRLHSLDLNYTEVTDSGIPFLGRLKELQDLCILGTAITDEGAEKLHQMLPTCEIHRNADLNASLFRVPKGKTPTRSAPEASKSHKPGASFRLLNPPPRNTRPSFSDRAEPSSLSSVALPLCPKAQLVYRS